MSLGEGDESRGCAEKLRRGKLRSAQYVENYIRVAVMWRGISGCRARSAAVAGASRRGPPPIPATTATRRGPHARYTDHVYLSVILIIFPLMRHHTILLVGKIFYLIIYLFIYYVILYNILFYFILMIRRVRMQNEISAMRYRRHKVKERWKEARNNADTRYFYFYWVFM